MFWAGQEGAWAIFRFGQEYPKFYDGHAVPARRRRNSGSRWCRTGSPPLPTPNPTVTALSQLALSFDSTVLMSHSQSGIFPSRPPRSARKALRASSIEPGACPANGDLKPYRNAILVLFGDYVDSRRAGRRG